MTLLAVQDHVRTLLQGLTTPQLLRAGAGPLEAYIAPPSITTDTMTAPQAYVWGGRVADRRQTMPRNKMGATDWTQPAPSLPTLPVSSAGFRKAPWRVDVWLAWLLPAAEDPVTFPLLIGAVTKQLSIDLMAIQLTDPETGDVSQMIEIAESIDLDYTTPQATADEATLLYGALLTVSVTEVYQL